MDRGVEHGINVGDAFRLEPLHPGVRGAHDGDAGDSQLLGHAGHGHGCFPRLTGIIQVAFPW